MKRSTKRSIYLQILLLGANSIYDARGQADEADDVATVNLQLAVRLPKKTRMRAIRSRSDANE